MDACQRAASLPNRSCTTAPGAPCTTATLFTSSIASSSSSSRPPIDRASAADSQEPGQKSQRMMRPRDADDPQVDQERRHEAEGAHGPCRAAPQRECPEQDVDHQQRSEEHTSELQSLMRISYAVFCLKKKNKTTDRTRTNIQLT